ncbi:MAG: hypothetical protein K2Y21_05135 [Phycisphaerales bacterium]|nr:hypothetical protein [Phycisphaerales bacterium]
MSAHAVHAHDGHSGGHASDLSHHPLLADSNVRLNGSGGGLSMLFLLMGVAGVAATVGAAFTGAGKLHAMASFQLAAMGALAICLGGMFFTLVMHLTAAGWSVTLRRIMEQMAALAPVMLIIAAIVPVTDLLVTKGLLYTWMNPSYETNYLLGKKAGFLNPGFFLIRLGVYFLAWTLISVRLKSLSIAQDRSGDKWLTNKARFTSAWGMLVFALTTAFASFDLLMSMDFRFFSTMWGVYFFAGAAFSSAATIALVASSLLRAGRLQGLVTSEHFHDLGKLMFSFTVFWSYIAFSQYFLIWYSNIPEETIWFTARKSNGWESVFYLLCFGHFIAPFLVLVFRDVKRSPNALILVGLWMLFIHFVDMFFIVRPMVTTRPGAEALTPFTNIWVDVAAVLGLLGVLGFALTRLLGTAALVPIRDPRLPEALEHKNYV